MKKLIELLKRPGVRLKASNTWMVWNGKAWVVYHQEYRCRSKEVIVTPDIEMAVAAFAHAEGIKPNEVKKEVEKMSEQAEAIWQVYGGNKTAQDAAREFARTYWAEPRKITGFKPDGTFKVVRGLREYRVFEKGDLWAIEVVAESASAQP